MSDKDKAQRKPTPPPPPKDRLLREGANPPKPKSGKN